MGYGNRGVCRMNLKGITSTDKLSRSRWCMMFCTFGLTNAYGVYQDYYIRVHLSNYPPSTIGWIGSFQVFLRTSGYLILYRSTHPDFIFLPEFAGGFIAGIWFDKGHFYPMICAFSLLFLFSFVGTFLSLKKSDLPIQELYAIILPTATVLSSLPHPRRRGRHQPRIPLSPGSDRPFSSLRTKKGVGDGYRHVRVVLWRRRLPDLDK
jgi:hypothetical protein